MIRQMHKRIINMKKKNPFKTPEGYFDNFAADFMARLPENEPVTVERKQTRVKMLRPLLYAACLLAICFGGYLVWQQSEAENHSVKMAETIEQHDQYVDDYLDCAMLDNGDIYACISE